jgi:hypothetical protein
MKIRKFHTFTAVAILSGMVIFYCTCILPFLSEAEDKSIYAEIQKSQIYNKNFDGLQALFVEDGGSFLILSTRVKSDRGGGVWLALNKQCHSEEICHIGDLRDMDLKCKYIDNISSKYNINNSNITYLKKYCH